MESLIVSVLKSKGSLKEKKLLKKVDKKLQESGKTVDEEKFRGALARLLESKEVLKQANDELALNKVQVTLKRSREEDDAVSAAKPKAAGAGDEEDDAPLKIKKKFNYPDLWKNGEQYWREGTLDDEYLRTNPDRITRLFCGNLSRKITEEDLMQRIEGITYIKWITDKQTGEFYGSSFLEMKDAPSAASAVMQDKSKFMGRPLKIYYCPPRPGDVWPPSDFVKGSNSSSMGNGNVKKNPSTREKTEKPPGCKKLFAGNLSYDIDDDTMVDFFKDCGTLVGLRWLTRQETGEFRGCAYVEFSCSEEAEAAIQLDGQELLGRSIRLDWTI